MASTTSDLNIVSRVPPKVWEQIFGHVSVLQLLDLRLTCHSWRSIVDGCPELLKRILLKFPEGFVLDRDYEPEYLVPVRNLALEKVRISTVDTWWPTFAERLVCFSLSGCKISVSTLLQMPRPMTNLKDLQLSKMRMWKSSALAVNFQMKHLEKLSADDINDDIISFLGPILPFLKWIDFKTNVYYADNILHISESVIIDYLRLFKHTLKGITMNYFPAMLNEILQLKQLTHLMLPNGSLNGQDLTTIGSELSNLKCIHVCLSAEIGKPTFLETMPELEEIFLRLQSNKSLDFTGLRNPKLIRFKLRSNNPISSTLFRYLENSPKIVEICFEFCKFSSWFEVFAVIELFCHSLQRLELYYVSVYRSDDYLSEYFDGLKYLKLTSCEMDKPLLITLISLCPRLEEIHLDSLSNFNDEVLLVLCQKLKHLEKLALTYCAITDSAADYIVEHCRTLRKLSILNCRNLTDGTKNKLKRLENLRCEFN